MTKRPDMTGDTYADIVVWRWNRNRMHWSAMLKDGTELRAVHQRFSRQTRWWPAVYGVREVWRGRDHYATPDEAQKAAFDRWKRTSTLSTRHIRLLTRVAEGDCPRATQGEYKVLCELDARLRDNLQMESALGADTSAGYIITALHTLARTEAACRMVLREHGVELSVTARTR